MTGLKHHHLSEAERAWLEEAASNPKFDPKTAKIKLHGKIPDDFDAKKIDPRLYANSKITPLGLYYLKPDAPIFCAVERVIEDIRAEIFRHPGIEAMTASSIAERIKLPEQEVGIALQILGHLGGFFSGATLQSDPERVIQFNMTGDDAYDEYRRYRSLDELMDRVYSARALRGQGWSPLYLGDDPESAAPAVEHQSIKRNTAFVLMAIDPNRAELEDVYNTIKETCHEFGVIAFRADEIEHQDQITDRILEEISTCEYLIADLSDERPNVYYEVGYAHALHKKPILYRRTGTHLHFDLSVHNVPEYKNVTQLREMLRRRLEAILGRTPKVLD